MSLIMPRVLAFPRFDLSKDEQQYTAVKMGSSSRSSWRCQRQNDF
jgi:hypothetical protein